MGGISAQMKEQFDHPDFVKLNDRYQQFLGLMLSGKSDEAIRQVLQLPNEGALWTLRSRALSKLKEEFEKIKSTQGGRL